MRKIGFSTGAVARGDFGGALDTLRRFGVEAVELSALRLSELAPLSAALPTLDLGGFTFVSVHAPSRFERGDEESVLVDLARFAKLGYPVVVHPDVIFEFDRWRGLGDRLLIENMDKRKAIGRTVDELEPIFEQVPEARFCFDIGHARQVDPSMTEASLLLRAYGSRLAQVHMSEVNTASRHDPISLNAVAAFGSVAALIPEDVPVILESLIDEGQSDIETEIGRARKVFGAVAQAETRAARMVIAYA